MKKEILKLPFIIIFMLAINVSFSQNVVINYQTWNPPFPPCDVFVNPTNVPATINGTPGNIVHQTQVGDVTYSSSDQSIQLQCQFVSAADYRGTRYVFNYNFKVGYSYQIEVIAAELVNTVGFPTAPSLNLNFPSFSGGGGIVCVGPQTVSAFGGNGPPSAIMINTTFLPYYFSFGTLTSAFPGMGVTSVPAFNGGTNSIRIRKITVIETAPSCPNTVTITGTYSTALTQSKTWINSSGQTTILNTASVKLDASPGMGYIELKPVVSSDFFLSQPTTGVFVAQPLDGCGPGIPAKGFTTPEIADFTKPGIVSDNLYPNPTDGKVSITFSKALVHAVLSIIDYNGIMVTRLRASGNKVNFDLSSFAPGVYFVRIEENGKIITRKVVKQ
jgi:hypothetical protein